MEFRSQLESNHREELRNVVRYGCSYNFLSAIKYAHLGAEGVGFEPTVPCDTTVFETARFGHSRTPPQKNRV